MSATIKDIAKMVGVNPSTVSRVINGTASISEETRNKINKAMKDLDYHPNSFARSLVNGSTFTIGLVIDVGNRDAFSNAFFIQSVTAIEMVAGQKGYNVLITNKSHSKKDSAISKLILERKIDGIILPVQCMSDEIIRLMEGNHFPFVVMGEPARDKERICWVDVDNEKGSRQAVRHLLSKGYRNPMLLVEDKKTIFEGKRMSGFQHECSKENIVGKIHTYTEQRIVDVLDEIEKGVRVTDSFICANNTIAYHLLKHLKKKAIGNQIGIITFDNYPLAEYMEPALTAIDIDTYRMGEEAAEMLFDSMKNGCEKTRSKLIETNIFERESTNRRKEEKSE